MSEITIEQAKRYIALITVKYSLFLGKQVIIAKIGETKTQCQTKI